MSDVTTFTTDAGLTASIDMQGARETVHAYIFGAQAARLSSADRVEVYLACDGFGMSRADMLDYMQHGWDWSHVRDSSPRGLNRAMAAIIERQTKVAA